MEVYGFSTLWQELSAKYLLDERISFNIEPFHSIEGASFCFIGALSSLNSYSKNKFSDFFLTRKHELADTTTIQLPLTSQQETFTTWIAANYFGNILLTKYWTITEPTSILQNTAFIAVTGSSTAIDSTYFFDIKLIDEVLCKISHETDGIIRYLTVDTDNNLSFTKDNGQDDLKDYSSQIFYYVYDRQSDYIAFSKNVSDIAWNLSYNSQTLTLIAPLTGSSSPFSSKNFFKVKAREDISNSIQVKEPWVSYQQTTENNQVDINSSKSFSNLQNNYLLHTEIENISGNILPTNIITLKNISTPENNTSRNNPYFREDAVTMREYSEIFSGTKQEGGYDNINLAFQGYTVGIKLPANKITYFHIPQDFTPFDRLNVLDSGLIEAGAIAGNHPLKSDKIFKKKADYKYSSPFGNVVGEEAGNFLCTWLSGCPDITQKPIWVDRYYNPKRLSFVQALTANTDSQVITYVSFVESLFNQVEAINPEIDIFDRPSSLTFEKGCYYAYHHLGEQDITQQINLLEDSFITNTFSILSSNNTSITNSSTTTIFDGSIYAMTSNLSAVTDKMTIMFWLKPTTNWDNDVVGNIIGNYIDDGITIYKGNNFTHLVHTVSGRSLYTYNTDFTLLNTTSFDDNIKFIIKRTGLQDYFVLTDNGTLYRVDAKDIQRQKIVYGPLASAINFAQTEDGIYFLTSISPDFVYYNINTNLFTANSGLTGTQYTAPSLTSDIQTIDIKDDDYYFTDGTKTCRDDNIFYFQQGSVIYKWDSDLDTKTAFISSQTDIQDFCLDYDKNFWILHDNTKITKLDSTRTLLLSASLSGDYVNYKIDIANKDYTNQHIILTTQAPISGSKLQIQKLNYSGDILTTSLFTQTTSNCWYPTAGEYLRQSQDNNLIIKLKLKNLITEAVEVLTTSLSLSGLDSTYHHFALTFNAKLGEVIFYINGEVSKTITFDPYKYIFANALQEPLFIGTVPFYNNVALTMYTANKTNFLKGEIKDLNIYSDSLTYFDINNFIRKEWPVKDIIFDCAAGTRSYIEEVERVFKYSLPGNKSQYYNLQIKNSGITDNSLRTIIEARIREQLSQITPGTSLLNNIEWIN